MFKHAHIKHAHTRIPASDRFVYVMKPCKNMARLANETSQLLCESSRLHPHPSGGNVRCVCVMGVEWGRG